MNDKEFIFEIDKNIREGTADVDPSLGRFERTPEQAAADFALEVLSQYYDVGVGEFDDHFVELNPNGNVTVRPNTPFGAWR